MKLSSVIRVQKLDGKDNAINAAIGKCDTRTTDYANAIIGRISVI
jgi:hypothetical protein